MQETHHSISMAGCKHTWDEFDKDAKKLGMNRSELVQYLYTKFKEQKRWFNIRVTEILLLLMMAIVLLVLIMRV